MHRLFTMLAVCALGLLIGMSAVTHAMEPIGCIDTTMEMSVAHSGGHVDNGLGDDGEPAAHHHGGCHGHHVSTTPDTDTSVPHLTATDLAPPRDFASPLRRGASPGLRPPIA